MSGVFVSGALTCGTERLAWKTSREETHASVKVCEWEGAQIRPDRCDVQEPRFHLRDQIGDREGFDLTKSDCAQASDCAAESKVNAAVASAEGDVSKGRGIIHMEG